MAKLSIRKLLKKLKQRKPGHIPASAEVFARPQHNICRENINKHALMVVAELQKHGFQAYIVGGGVRDLLLDLKPKDFDVATDAKPEEVKHVFRNCRLIGRRFRLAHVYFGRYIIEVATFRSQKDGKRREHSEQGMLVRDNVYGHLEDDAWRRDFTVNALYYDSVADVILDFTGGMQDMQDQMMRIIGDPETRFQEDPVRMMRAVRFAAKLNFSIDPVMTEPMKEQLELLQHVSSVRLFEEIMKFYRSGYLSPGIALMREYGLFALLFPAAEASTLAQNSLADTFIKLAVKTTDARINSGKHLNPGFLFAVLLWWPLQELIARQQEKGVKLFPALHRAMDQVISEQIPRVAISKRFIGVIREMWTLQYLLPSRRGKRAWRCYQHARFRAAYDFLLLRAEAGEDVGELGDWWTQFQQKDQHGQQQMIRAQEKTRSR